MKSVPYKKLNAFSSGKSTGNPAACLLLSPDQTLTEEKMLSIAREHKGFVSEVIYSTPVDDSAFRLRYFSSECEVEFCGHGTIACLYDLIRSDSELEKWDVITIHTNKGPLEVYNEIASLDAVFITAPDPVFLPSKLHPKEIAEKLDTVPEKIETGFPVEIIDAGLRTLIVPITDLNTVLGLAPEEQALKAFCLSHEIDIILVFTTEVYDRKNRIRTRVFAPRFGYLEDPATGSGNSAMGYYLLKHNMWDGAPIGIEQNGYPEDYNTVRLKTREGKVLFGGNAVIKIDGKYLL